MGSEHPLLPEVEWVWEGLPWVAAVLAGGLGKLLVAVAPAGDDGVEDSVSQGGPAGAQGMGSVGVHA